MKETFKNMGMNLLMEFLVSMLKIDENKPSNAFYSIESGFKQIISSYILISTSILCPICSAFTHCLRLK
jgi:hypothetical protein